MTQTMTANPDDKLYRRPALRPDGLWAISDLYCAGFLIARGAEVTGIEPTSRPGRYIFLLSGNLSADFDAWTANSEVRGRDFVDALHQLKGLLREFEGRSR
jgi:hypothetical protein